MVKIRLSRIGKKHQASYRIVVADSRGKRDGRHIEILGHYNPSLDPYELKINQERLNYWISQGAQLTETVQKLIVKKKGQNKS